MNEPEHTKDELRATIDLQVGVIDMLNDQIDALKSELSTAQAQVAAARADLAIAEKARETYREGFEGQQRAHGDLIESMRRMKSPPGAPPITAKGAIGQVNG